MQFTGQELIDRARVYLDDDNKDTNGWLAPTSWLALLNTELAQLYRRHVRNGLVTPPATDQSLNTSPTLQNCLAIHGVAQVLPSGLYRLLTPAQSAYGQKPFYGTPISNGPGHYWMAEGGADNLTIKIEPDPTLAHGSYIARFTPTLAYITALSQTVDVPYGADERLVLGIARRANLKDSTTSALLERLMAESDAELAFQAFGRLKDSPRVRRVVSRTEKRGVMGNQFPGDPREWRFY